jgi:hypothetical protein
MFDKADMQNRLNAIEHAVNTLGVTLKMDILEMKGEMAQIRQLLERATAENVRDSMDQAVPIKSKQMPSPKVS